MSNLIIKNKSTHALVLNESIGADGEKKYVFKGVFTPIEVKNRNERIYGEKEVLKHLSYLREKIKKEGCILGELDHPEGRFEIFLKDVSHKITDLWYDPAKRCVMGQLELLDTPNGRTMKAIVDAGCPLFVSSRAAGVVGADSYVQIQQVFTYDIVATPGFEQCQLDAVSEAMKAMVTNFINESKTAKKSQNHATKYGIMNENVEVIETDSIPELNERKNLDIDMNNLTQPLMKEDVQVKISPEKAQELGLDLNGGGNDSTPSTEGDTTPTEHSADDILDITPTYAEQKDEIQDIQPEFNSADDAAQNTEGETETSGENQLDNPFMMESLKECKGGKKPNKKDEVKREEYDENDDISEEEEEVVDENETTPNPVADGKRGSETDYVQHSSNTKEEKNEKTMKKDDSETVSKLQNKKKELKDSTNYTLDYYQSILNEYNVKNQIKNNIINTYPFAVSLSESNFEKFATLSDQDKKLCADYIFENDIFDIRQINDQFMRPLQMRVNETKNYIRLANSSDLELYYNSPRDLRESIDKMAELYIIESKSDADEFWRRTGIRNFAKNQVYNETFVKNFNEKMAVSEHSTDWQNGYNESFIQMIGAMM